MVERRDSEVVSIVYNFSFFLRVETNTPFVVTGYEPVNRRGFKHHIL